jgi:rare lipoprotein A
MRIQFFFKINAIFTFIFILSLHGYSQDTSESKSAIKKVFKSKEKTLYGTASFYANKFEGRRTANGEIFSHKKLTAACNQLPLGTWIKVTNLRNGKSVVLKTNDRLHPKMNRLVDLTLLAARKLDFVSYGLTKVKVVVISKNKHK